MRLEPRRDTCKCEEKCRVEIQNVSLLQLDSTPGDRKFRRLRTMRSIALITFALVASGLPVHAQESSAKTAKIERLLALTNAQSVMDQMFAQIRSMTASMVPPGASATDQAKAQEVQDKVMDLVRARMSWDRLRPQYAKIYDDTFSEEEIDGMLAFYQSRAGRAMLEKTPVLISKTMGVVQGLMGDIMPDIQRIAKEAAQK